MFRWPLLFFILAIIAAVLGFSGVADAATDVAVISFFVFAALFVLSLFAAPARRTAGGIANGFGGVVLLAATAIVAVWLSDQYSLEDAGAQADRNLAEARENLGEVVEDLPEATREAREGVADALDRAEEAVDPDDPASDN